MEPASLLTNLHSGVCAIDTECDIAAGHHMGIDLWGYVDGRQVAEVEVSLHAVYNSSLPLRLGFALPFWGVHVRPFSSNVFVKIPMLHRGLGTNSLACYPLLSAPPG